MVVIGGFAVDDDNDHYYDYFLRSCSCFLGLCTNDYCCCCCCCSHGGLPVPKITTTSSQSHTSKKKKEEEEEEEDEVVGACVVLALAFVLVPVTYSLGKFLLRRNSVLTLQVGLEGATDQIQRDLGSISKVSQTRRGLHLILSETASHILNYLDYCCVAAFSKVNIKFMDGWRNCFDLLYLEERKKVTDVLVSRESKGPNSTNNRYVIVTILVAASGKRELPAINSYTDLDRALYSLTSIHPADIEAVKVFWTSRDDIDDYPSLRCL